MTSSCAQLHKWIATFPVHGFPFNAQAIPMNGIYVLFEQGELAHGWNRIVRVGTHTGNNQLPSRLWQHFENENKDRSIFRKNIGRCFLNQAHDPYLEKWEWDLTTKKAKEKYTELIDAKKQDQLEKRISAYFQTNFRFVVFEVNDASKRLELESKLLSTIVQCEECHPSQQWLGNSSPIAKIKENGIWNVQGCNGQPLNENDWIFLNTIKE
ncbi:MAG: hypothetical protein IPJ89_00515 [Candidatus Iainarchaeum archaeon]|uniref:GIY-YIG domain-containing protein n=1 Tax=Candidatus Iainarchaeum sp. TaxID=3101447 RepID=A0A7T9DJW8_9ARCH|nr:MAG: hypothetical protein IPJ89_00515 [Candidatus Diapherotrites archaeon]